jgi:two-component system, OmpR family, phosphate regulon sensor histidine kinase PhoR
MVLNARSALLDGRTYLRILYLLISFPLSLLYFIVIVTGLSLGLGLAVIGIGLLIALATAWLWRGFAMIERELTIHLLGIAVPPMSAPAPPATSFSQGVGRLLKDPVTWKSLVYLLVDFFFGVFAFVLVVVLFSLCVSLATLPLTYVGATILYNQDPTTFAGTNVAFPITGQLRGDNLLLSIAACAGGILLTLVSLRVLNAIGYGWGQFASAMLGQSETRLALASAEAEAATQRARAESADRSRQELIINASHELRTPVASIRAHVDSLLRPEREVDEETRQYLAIVSQEAERLGVLVDDVLEVARADAGQVRAVVRAVDAGEVVRAVCEALAPLARRERNLSLVGDCPPGLPQVVADRERLTQVLTNLVRNAVNYTQDGGIISVRAEDKDQHVVVSVSDTGIGIPAAELERIFERFHRVDASRARDSGGSGLGLAIARDLVVAMGGSIDAESTPGIGSTFRITLRKAPPGMGGG